MHRPTVVGEVDGVLAVEEQAMDAAVETERGAATRSTRSATSTTTDVAQETIKFTRNQILVSAGTSVLAQANQVPQQALQLLR